MAKTTETELNQDKTETTNNPPIDSETNAPAATEVKSLDDLLAGGDDSNEYKQQRGDRAREVVLGDDDTDDIPEGDDRPHVDASSVNDEDRAAAKLFFWFYDDSTAKLFSQNVYGTWDHSAQFRMYKNLQSAEYKDLIECAALVYKRYKFRWGPEMVIAASLGTTLVMKAQLANQLKKQMAGQPAPSDEKIRNINTKKNNKQTKASML